MRVIQVMESTATGTLSMVLTISNRLAAEGHDVYVIFSIHVETPQNLRSLFHPKVELRHIQMKGPPLPFVITRLRKAIGELRPDIVHLHSSFAGFLGRVATIFGAGSARFFYSPHCISFMRADVSALSRLSFIGLELLASLRTCTYVGCSVSECAAVRRYLHRHIVLVENAIERSVTGESGEPGVDRATTSIKRVVMVGGIRLQKNPPLFAQIARLFDRQGVEFVWIGDGDERFKQTLFAAGVRVTGWLSRAEVLQQLERADIFLSTSSWEGMPVSVIEAMSVGTLVLATKCAGNVDAVRHAQTGFLFESAAEAIVLLNRMADDGPLRKEIARNAKREARERFSEDRFFYELRSLYAIPQMQLAVR
ncbi:glycosyltransferase [Burkholderia sp. S171]|uniref:glycosyltransferase n=1 Tax=Burkholderia sp. S171 TaxID=1641860 RepID=UPI00131E4B76|nr:glycosyltransferase [Burkholderia sp. S171]